MYRGWMLICIGNTFAICCRASLDNVDNDNSIVLKLTKLDHYWLLLCHSYKWMHSHIHHSMPQLFSTMFSVFNLVPATLLKHLLRMVFNNTEVEELSNTFVYLVLSHSESFQCIQKLTMGYLFDTLYILM